MLLSFWLVSGVLFSTSVHAFYPYHRIETVTGTDKADAQGLDKRTFCGLGFEVESTEVDRVNCRQIRTEDKTGSIANSISEPHALKPTRVKTDDVDQPAVGLRVRATRPTNAYNVIAATPPTLPNSMPVDQDGTDYSYFSTVKFGSSGRELHMLIDTGAANSWVMSSDCTTKPCTVHNTFGKDDSTTFVETDSTFNVTYGTGSVAGTVVNDTISFAGISIPFTFGVATEVSSEFLNYPMDGILGLARAEPDEQAPPTLMDVLKSQKKLQSSLFGINLQRFADNSNDGVVNFGDWDRSKVDGDVTWVSTLSKTGPWEVPIDDAGVNNKAIKFTGKSAIMDTGSSFILLPPDDAKKLHDLIPRARQTGETFEIPCSANAVMQFIFAGVPFNMTAKDYLGKPSVGDFCYSQIIGRQAFGSDQWLFGDAFLKSVYSIYDVDQNRMGFGNKRLPGTIQNLSAGGSNNSTTSASTRNLTSSSSVSGPYSTQNASAATESGRIGQTTAASQTTSFDASSTPTDLGPIPSTRSGSTGVKLRPPNSLFGIVAMLAMAYW
ncbi:MAG: hypothetical protein M1816_005843 [Peltula sp. TS41687]|nr:MAG: hypothetical protein M1816_005843 [Peltula sp. TS41687]